ncbi:hypothetical protein [Klebsiella pneumoniae]
MNKGKPRYICTNGRHLQKNCTGWSVNAMLIEHCTIIALIVGYMDTDRKTGFDTDVITKQIEVLNDKLIDLDKGIANITLAIEKGLELEQLINKGMELQQERGKIIKDIDLLVQRKAVYENKGSFEIAMFDFIEMIQWNVIIDTSNEIRNKIRSVIDRIIDEVTIDKVDGCISVRIKLIGNDVVFVFAGENRKPNWKFDVEYYSSSTDKNSESDLYIRNALETDALNKIFEQLDTLRGKYQKLLKHIMNEILPVAGYPAIDGKMFWPNTSGNERVVVSYKGERHTLAVKGTLPANIAALIEDSGLKRKEFIEAYHIKNELNE